MGIGVDMIEVKRIARALQRPRFRSRIYSPREQAELKGRPLPSWAARFAAKEAVMKALGTGYGRGVGFAHISIVQGPYGRPVVELSGAALAAAQRQNIGSVLLSLSHTKEYAVAYAAALEEDLR